ncbi:MAG: hypothetical protein F4089_03800 [Gammaproteobacteria bacterium]|nr:hypothetical protein [Gammaproteobacteria bacterium]
MSEVKNPAFELGHFSLSRHVERMDVGRFDTADLMRSTRWSILFVPESDFAVIEDDALRGLLASLNRKMEDGCSGDNRTMLVLADRKDESLARRIRVAASPLKGINVVVAIDAEHKLKEYVAPDVKTAFAIIGDSTGRILHTGLGPHNGALMYAEEKGLRKQVE